MIRIHAAAQLPLGTYWLQCSTHLVSIVERRIPMIGIHVAAQLPIPMCPKGHTASTHLVSISERRIPMIGIHVAAQLPLGTYWLQCSTHLVSIAERRIPMIEIHVAAQLHCLKFSKINFKPARLTPYNTLYFSFLDVKCANWKKLHIMS